MQAALIFKNLLYNREFTSKVLPFLKEEYFSDRVEKEVYKIFNSYITDYSDIPTLEVIEYEISKNKNLGQEDFKRAKDFVSSLKEPQTTPDLKYLLDTTEEWCLNQSCFNAIQKSILILDDTSKTPLTAIPEILKEAVSISFNSDVGHDYSNDVEERYNRIHQQSNRMSTGIDWLDRALGGGLSKKTFNLFLAQSGGGKSLAKSHLSSHFYKAGLNCLYVTLELGEERIGERHDANLMDIDVLKIKDLDIETYKENLKKITSKTKGRLFIKEYPPASITAQHVRALLNELKIKQKFIPDIIFIDYINLMNSSRYKAASGANSYTILKAVSEELVAIAKEFDVCVVSSTQLNRGGISDSDPDMTSVSDSMGIVHTADSLFAMIRSEELDSLNQVLFKCLKTRFSDLTNAKHLIGVDWNKMKLIDQGDLGSSFIAKTQQQTNQTQKPAIQSKPISAKKFDSIQV